MLPVRYIYARIHYLLTNPLNEILMKKLLLLMAAAVMTVACTNESSTTSREAEPADVTLTFSPYEMERIDTRAATSIADFCTHLDVWIVDGENTIDMHQTTSDADFGTLSVTLDKTKPTPFMRWPTSARTTRHSRAA